MQTVRYHIPKLQDYQARIVNAPQKRKVIVAGRRGGKTTMFAAYAARKAIAKQTKILMLSPSQDQVDIFWNKLKVWLAEPIQAGLITKNETTRTFTFWNYSIIRCKTGRDPDALRGADADIIIFDECALLNPDTWYVVGAPMLADRADSEAIFISTPNKKNWFYHLYKKALADDTGRWLAAHFTSHENKYLESIDDVVADMAATADMLKQEIEAVFLDTEGSIFRVGDIQSCAYPVESTPEPYEGRFYMSIDWARSNDYTVALVADIDSRRIVDMYRSSNVRFEHQLQSILAMVRKWRVSHIVSEYNSIGGPQTERLEELITQCQMLKPNDPQYILQNTGVASFQTTAANKPIIIENLAVAIEHHEIQFPEYPSLLAELETYALLRQNKLGKPDYGAPDGLHDDTVMSLAILNSAMSRVTARYVY